MYSPNGLGGARAPAALAHRLHSLHQHVACLAGQHIDLPRLHVRAAGRAGGGGENPLEHVAIDLGVPERADGMPPSDEGVRAIVFGCRGLSASEEGIADGWIGPQCGRHPSWTMRPLRST